MCSGAGCSTRGAPDLAAEGSAVTSNGPTAAAGQPATASAAASGDLHTGYPGDELCILPPPPALGFQIHIGPSDYAQPAPEYRLLPQQEVTTDHAAVSGNTEPAFYYYRQFRMRPGTHHNIVATADMEHDFGRRIAITNRAHEDNPEGGVLPPENQGVGVPIGPRTPLLVNLHSINTTDRPLLREVWVNFWYRDPSRVTEKVEQLAQAGDALFAIAPHADTMLGPFQCQATGAGRILWFYGHRHANNVRFSAWRLRGDQRLLIYEAYNWEDPMLLEFSSIKTNPTSDRARGVEGGYSGILDLAPGDRLEWECHVINRTDQVLRFTNQNFLGEMCIMDAEVVGANCLVQ
jgi:hypothetical protein